MNKLIISIHVPKTAGTTFGNYLKRQFREKMLFVYPCLNCDRWICDKDMAVLQKRKMSEPCQNHARSDREVARQILVSNVKCIHGHFSPGTFNFDYRKNHHVAWLRDPVDRTLSQWEFWVRNPQGRGKKADELMGEGDKETVLRFMANTQTKFLKGLPLKHFRFLGITEHFEEGLRQFDEMFDLPSLDMKSENVNPDKGIGRYQVNAGERIFIERLNQEDLKLYAEAAQFYRINRERGFLKRAVRKKMFVLRRDFTSLLQRLAALPRRFLTLR